MRRIATGFLSLVVACVLSFPGAGAIAYGGELSTASGVDAAMVSAGDPASSSPTHADETGSRTYASNATGAPRAAGRTEASVRALTDAAREATRGYAPGDLVKAGSVPATVHVAQFGAYGDGEHDDHGALQAAFDSGAQTILFEHDAAYKVNRSLKLRHGNVTLLGNSATIVTDADYDDADERLLSVTGKVPNADLRDAIADDWKNHPEYFVDDVGIYQLNMLARAYDAVDASDGDGDGPDGPAGEAGAGDAAEPPDPADETGPDDSADGEKAYSKQLMVQMASNVDIFDCTFTTEEPGDGRKVDGCTALDAYTGWHDVTIERCTVRDFCDKEYGGGIWIRDHFNMGSSNMVFKRNDFEKMCHDEILAVFNSNAGKAGVTARPVEDVLIAENTFVMYGGSGEKSASPSVMAITVKCGRGVLVENNDLNVQTTGGLVWSSYSSGVVVRDNDIVQARSHVSGDTNFLMFRDTIDLVEGNRMTLSALDETAALNHRYVFSGVGTVRGNTVVSGLALESVTSGQGAVEGNDVRLNAPVHVVFDGSRTVTGNKVELNANVDQYFQFFQTAFAQDVVLSGNVFDNKVAGSLHKVLVLNKATMGGHIVHLSGNVLMDSGLGSGAQLLFLVLLDEEAQENCVVFSGNVIPNLEAYGMYQPDKRHTYVFLEEVDGGESGGNGSSGSEEPGPGGGNDAYLETGGGEGNPVGGSSGQPAPVPTLISINRANVVLAQVSYAYSGKERKPAVKSVELDGKKLVAGTDYRVSYGANRHVGTGMVIVTGMGGFGGSAVAMFEILPKGTAISKLVAGKRGFAAKWKRQTAQVTGYQLQCSLTRGFRATRTFAVAKAKVTSKRVTRLKPGKRYYVRVRTYKKVGTVTHYSAWSKTKSVTTRP